MRVLKKKKHSTVVRLLLKKIRITKKNTTKTTNQQNKTKQNKRYNKKKQYEYLTGLERKHSDERTVNGTDTTFATVREQPVTHTIIADHDLSQQQTAVSRTGGLESV